MGCEKWVMWADIGPQTIVTNSTLKSAPQFTECYNRSLHLINLINNRCLLVPGPLLSVLHGLSHLILIITHGNTIITAILELRKMRQYYQF